MQMTRKRTESQNSKAKCQNYNSKFKSLQNKYPERDKDKIGDWGIKVKDGIKMTAKNLAILWLTNYIRYAIIIAEI